MSTSIFEKSICENSISPYKELIAYEQLYAQRGMSLKKITNLTVSRGSLPSQALESEIGLIPLEEYDDIKNLIDSKIGKFSLAINRTPSWPDKLKDSERPAPLIYYRGDIGYMDLPSVSVVGARKASREGLMRARKIAHKLSENGICVTTGLAEGIDTAASLGALEAGGRTIAVIGTPIDEYYPKKNQVLQDFISAKHLLLSQVPFYRYSKQPFKSKKYYFPERNELMAAVSDATIIVEASDTSGTLTQARACLHQQRPLFIMKNCLDNPNITWPEKYIDKKGVFVLEDIKQVLDALK